MKTENSNIMQCIQKHLLLVLEGGVPPRQADVVKTADGAGVVKLLSYGNLEGRVQSRVRREFRYSTASNKISAHILKLQQKKLDSLAEVVVQHFEKTGARRKQ
jgi:hypothetical protein